MTVTRDVILDLWPMYEAGELSADGRTLVEQFLGDDPEFAAILRRAGDATRRVLAHPPAPVAAAERQVVDATRRRVALQRWLAGVATMMSLVPLSVANVGDGVFLVVQRYPAILLTLLPATALWLWLWRLSRTPKA
jgi:anti-sigma factor RsiW